MNESTEKSDYLLLFRGTDWDKGLSPEEIQQVMGRMMAWLEQLHRRGLIKAGQPLGQEGKSISGGKEIRVADGPFVESKEAVGGYLILRVCDLEEATEIAKEFPCLDYGGLVEVRPIAEECPTFQRVKKQLADMAA